MYNEKVYSINNDNINIILEKDEEYIKRYDEFEKLPYGFDIIKEDYNEQEYLDFVKTVHQITTLNSNTPKEISLGVLGVELIDTLFRIIFKIPRPTLSIQNNENNSFSYKFRKPFELEYTKDNQEIAKAFIEWGKSSYGFLPAIQSADMKSHYINTMQDSASYIKTFYVSPNNSDSILNKQAPNPNDLTFIDEFRKKLDILAPLK